MQTFLHVIVTPTGGRRKQSDAKRRHSEQSEESPMRPFATLRVTLRVRLPRATPS